MRKEKEWIIAISNTAEADVELKKAKLTADDMKKYLLVLIQRDREEFKDSYCPDGYDETRSVEEVEEVMDKENKLIQLHAYACYDDFHIEYTARLNEAVEEIDTTDNILEESINLTDHTGNYTKLAEEVMYLSVMQPSGCIQDADTILADIMKASDFCITGIADDILRLYLEVKNKDDFESLFYLMADVKLEDYLMKAKTVMEKNLE